MGAWMWVCNGGPNDTNVGGDSGSLEAVIGSLKFAMRALGATKGSVMRKGTLDVPVPVADEEDAGHDGGVS